MLQAHLLMKHHASKAGTSGKKNGEGKLCGAPQKLSTKSLPTSLNGEQMINMVNLMYTYLVR
jgi:hypothetical protein